MWAETREERFFLSNFLPDFWFLKKVTCNPSTHRHTYHHHHHTSRTIYSRFGEVEMSFLSWWSATESAIHLAVSSQLSQTIILRVVGRSKNPGEGGLLMQVLLMKKVLSKPGGAIDPLPPWFPRPWYYIWGTLAILRNLLRWRCVQLLV